MANPTLMRTLTDGMAAGPGTGKFARATMIAINQNRKALAEWSKMPPEAQDFYDKPYTVAEVESFEDFGPQTLGDLGGTAGLMFPNTPIR